MHRIAHFQINDHTDCDGRIIGSCNTSNAIKKGTLSFGVQTAQDQIIPVALEVLLVRNVGANIVSVGGFAEKGVKNEICCRFSRHSTTEIIIFPYRR